MIKHQSKYLWCEVLPEFEAGGFCPKFDLQHGYLISWKENEILFTA